MTAGTGLAVQDAAAGRVPGDKGTRLEQLVVELLGAPLASFVERVFDYVRMAELEIADYMEKFPAQAGELNATFRYLGWKLDVPAPEPVFRHHARELLQRVVDGESLRPGTQAEALMVLHVTSQHAPLRTEAVMVAVRLVRTVYGDVNGITDYVGSEPWPGACDELLDTTIRKLSCDRDCDSSNR